jgi:spore germination protein KC
VTADGETIGFAVAQLSLKTGRVATASHCKLIVLGQGLLEGNVLDPLNYFVTDLEINWGAVVVATGGKAEQTISGLNELEQNAEFNWQEFLNNNREVDVIAVNSIREIMLQAQDKSKSFLLTVLSVEKGQAQGGGSSESKQSSASTSSGGAASGGEQASLKAGERTAVFSDGVLAGELTMREMRGYSWLDRDVRKADFEVKTNDGTAVVRLKNKILTVRCESEQGAPVMRVRLNLYLDVTDLPGEIFQQGEPDRLEQAIADTVKQDILACDVAAKEMGVDVLGVNDRFYRFDKTTFDRVGKDLFRTARIEISVKATLSVT